MFPTSSPSAMVGSLAVVVPPACERPSRCGKSPSLRARSGPRHESRGWFRCALLSRHFQFTGLPSAPERWFTNLVERGNTGSASPYIILDELFHSGRLKVGDRILLAVLLIGARSGRKFLLNLHRPDAGAQLRCNTLVDPIHIRLSRGFPGAVLPRFVTPHNPILLAELVPAAGQALA
jgi:hypothetical protein